jgi:hypothetical protein
MKKRFSFILVLIYTISFIACSKKDNTTGPSMPNENPSALTAFIGDTISIAGKNLGTDPNALLIKFGTVPVDIISLSETSVKIVVPDNIEESAVKIHLFSGTNEIIPANDFKLKAPVIQSLSADSGFAGQQVIITGKGFSSSNKLKQISFGDKLLNAIDQSHTRLTIKVPDSIPAGKYTISVTVAGLKASAAELFNVILPTTPTFTGFSPQTAFIGDTITLEGEHLGMNADALIVNFGNVQANVVSASETSAKVVVPDEIEEGSVKIQLISGLTRLTSPSDFRLKAPVIDSITVTSGFSGQYYHIRGKGFRKSYKTEQVIFGNTTIAANLGTPGHSDLYTKVPKGLAAGKYTVKVVVAGMTATATDLFEVIVPGITSFTPHSGGRFTEITITGTNLANINEGNGPSVGFVDFATGVGNEVALIMSKNANQIKLLVPDLTIGNTYRIIVNIVGSSVQTTEPFTFTE